MALRKCLKHQDMAESQIDTGRRMWSPLYPKSVFGEDTLVNVSFEKQADGKLSGYIRIRSKTRGIALQSWGQDHLETEGRPLIGQQA
ncbi:hypothetical protein PRUPE_3G018100 [Prunus persica]|uniref:Coatomer beta subunit appendage platform domain-containing protein n=1 Tax=Prunus persica TaxID=3760 RepID=A0A251PTQ1_PRUPE|nr:hypothetical protein PRUPE_3G018100 [Prunus persica]